MEIGMKEMNQDELFFPAHQLLLQSINLRNPLHQPLLILESLNIPISPI
jgi:hypothetical protein